MRVGVLILLLVVSACGVARGVVGESEYNPAALADEITDLPGLDADINFRQFAGYLQVDAETNRSIFYWYAESQNDPSTDPLLWWSNGGPGCSGLMGFLTENGPFRPAEDGSGNLTLNPFSWNRISNTLFVESPAGVGFSFSNNASDYYVGDDRTAEDNLAALLAFYDKFPHLRANDLYLSSESYGGHYLPQLATLIITEAADEFPTFRGFLLGNPLTDLIENVVFGMAGTLCGHAIASEPACAAFRLHCRTNFSLVACAVPLVRVLLQAGALDRYGLDYPTCPTSGRARRQMAEGTRRLHGLFGAPLPDDIALKQLDTRQRDLIHFIRVLRRVLWHLAPRHALHFSQSSSSVLDRDSASPAPYDPCMESEETVYLNRADVRAALHVSPSVTRSWVSCNFETLHYDWLDELRFIETLYPRLIAADLRLVIQSGDDDTVCATLGTMEWMYEMFEVKPNGGSWRQWTFDSSESGPQIGGSRVDFEGITLITVHSAGHMVPTYTPERGFAVLTSFLAGNLTRLEAEGDESKK